MNIRKAYHRWMSAFLAFMMVATMIPTSLFQSTDSTAYGAHVIGGGGGISGTSSNGKWRANWLPNQQGVRISIVDNDGNIVLKNYDAIDIQFSDPTARGGLYKFSSIKFQDWDTENKIFEISVGELNNALIEAINAGPSSEMLSHLKGTLKGSGTKYPTSIDTMPQPILLDTAGTAMGNGEEVKAFFVDGQLGSYKKGGYSIPIDKISTTITNASQQKPAGTTVPPKQPTTTPTTPTNPNTTPLGEDKRDTTSNSTTDTITTPYGNVSTTWLRTHFMNTTYSSVDAAFNSGYLTASEQRALARNLKSAQTEMRVLTKTALDAMCNLTKADFNAGIEAIYDRYYADIQRYYRGGITYEYLYVLNSELRQMANSAKKLYGNGLTAMDNIYLSDTEKYYMLKAYASATSNGFWIVSSYASAKVTSGIQLEYNSIPLIGESIKDVAVDVVSDFTAKVSYKGARDFIKTYEELIKTSNDTQHVVATALAMVYGGNTQSILDNYVSSYDNESTGNLDSTKKGVFALAADIVDRFKDTTGSLKTTEVMGFLQENIDSKISAADIILKQQEKENMMSIEANRIQASNEVLASLGASAEQLVTAQQVYEQILPAIVTTMHADGFTDVTIEDILGIMEGETLDDKLNRAATGINTLGLGEWLKTLNIGSILGVGSGIDFGAMQNSKGYIYALLDMKNSSGNFVFDINIPVEKQSEFESVAMDKTSPAQKFMFMGYGIVFEPILWYAPVALQSGNEYTDGGEWRDEFNARAYRARVNYYMTPTAFARYQMSNTSRRWYKETGHITLGRVFPTSMYINEEITFFEGGTKNDGVIQPISDSAMFTTTKARHPEIAPKVSVKDMGESTYGYGWHFASGIQSESTIQVTWNDTVPSPGPAPDPTDLPDPSKKPDTGEPWDPSDPDYPFPEYPNGYPDKHFTIIKYYEDWDYSDPENPFVAERHGPTIREQNPNIIKIVDEPEYKVKDWYTTALDGNYPNENDSNEIYDVHYNQDTKEKTATSTGELLTTVELDKNNDGTEDTLVVLLVKKINQPAPLPPGSGAITIQQSQITKAVRTNNGNIGGAPWGSYDFQFYIGEFFGGATEHTAHTSGCNWCSGGKYHSSHWNHSTTSCPYGMPGSSGDEKLNFTFSGLHSISFGNNLEVGKGKHNELKPLIYSKGSGEDTSSYDFTLSSLAREEFNFPGDGRVNQGEEYVTVLWRYKDVPTMPIYKQQDIGTKYGESNWNIPASILPTNQKIPAKKRLDNGDRTYQLKINFGLNKSLSDLSATASCSNVGSGPHPKCLKTDQQNVQLISGNWDYMFNASTLVKTWRGKATNKSHADEKMLPGNTDPVQKTKSGEHFEVTMVADKQTIKFYPYIKMTYLTNSLSMAIQEESGRKVRQNTYVFAEQESSILPNDAIEVGWANGNEVNSIDLVSQQWSLHQRATNNGKAWNGKNQVLPGGAIYQLVIPKNTETDVKIVTYQTVVDSETRTWLSANLTGDEYTEAQVAQEHKQFVDTAVDVLDKLRIVQWVNKNFNASTAWPANWDETAATTEVCVRGGGVDLTKLGLSHKSNTESKYYMQKFDFGSPASEGDLDILKNEQITTVFKAFTDTEGNVYVATLKENGADVAGIVAKMEDLNYDTLSKKDAGVDVALVASRDKKWQDINSLLTDELKAIDDRTKFVTNVVKSLERNTGADKTAAWATNDGKWYNEAFDGIYLVRQATTLQIGFKDPLKRAAALDPALCPENKGESDLYSNAFLSQFCMNDRSDSPLAAGKDARYLGTFKGEDIQLPEMQGLYQTRKFYIPNANVQDLN